MKIRFGFVSNSSSSSFIVDKSVLDTKQVSGIKRLKEFDFRVKETDTHYYGYTVMDNIDIEKYLDGFKIKRHNYYVSNDHLNNHVVMQFLEALEPEWKNHPEYMDRFSGFPNRAYSMKD